MPTISFSENQVTQILSKFNNDFWVAVCAKSIFNPPTLSLCHILAVDLVLDFIFLSHMLYSAFSRKEVRYLDWWCCIYLNVSVSSYLLCSILQISILVTFWNSRNATMIHQKPWIPWFRVVISFLVPYFLNF